MAKVWGRIPDLPGILDIKYLDILSSFVFSDAQELTPCYGEQSCLEKLIDLCHKW